MSIIRKFRDCQSGLAAMEFALIMPALTLLLFGSVGMFDQFQAKQRAAQAADNVSDLLARSVVMNSAEVENVFDAAVLTLGKFADDAEVELVVVGYVYDEDEDEWVVHWSEGLKSSDVVDGDPIKIDSPKKDEEYSQSEMGFPKVLNNEMLVASKLKFDYSNALWSFGDGNMNFVETAVRKPRFMQIIEWDGEGGEGQSSGGQGQGQGQGGDDDDDAS